MSEIFRLRYIRGNEARDIKGIETEFGFPWSSFWIGSDELFRFSMLAFYNPINFDIIGLAQIKSFTKEGIEDYRSEGRPYMLDKTISIDYFEVSKRYRGQGYGTEMFNKIRSIYKNRRFILDSTQTAEHFWLANGFKFYDESRVTTSRLIYDNGNGIIED